MAITISGENNNDKILAQDGVIDQISGINIVGLITSSHINVGSNIQLGNAGIITATTFNGNLTGNVNSTSPLLLQTGGSERFRITGNNELGIAGANYGTSGQVLTSGGSGSAVSWTTISTDLVNDSSPQLGADLDTNGYGILVDDNKVVNFGNNNDLMIYHSGTHSYIKNKTNNLYIMSTNTEYGIEVHGNGKVRLNYDNSPKIETTNTGAIVTGIVTATSRVSLGNNTTNAVDLEFGTNRGSAGDTIANINWKWNNTYVAQIRGMAGSDTTNKDDAHLNFYTAAAGSLVERLRITSGGTVNIGGDYSNTTGKFKVTGQARFDGEIVAESVISVQSGGSINIPDKLIHSGDTDTAIRFPTNNTISFETTGSERLRIMSNGNVGIGTINAGAPLHIQSNSAGLSIRRTGQYLDFDGNFGGGGDQAIISSGGVRFYTSGYSNQRVIIDSNGNMGIGDNQPPNFTGYKSLSIHGSTGGALVFGDDGTDEWEVYGGDGVFKIYDRAATTTRLHLTNSYGQFGINTSSFSDTATALSLRNGRSDADHTILDIICNDNQTCRLTFSEDSNSSKGSIRYYYTGDANYMSFYTNGGASTNERLRINSNGSFNIGGTYTGTTHKLQVDNGTTHFKGRVFIRGTMSFNSTPFGANVTYDTGISVNAGGYGGSILAICSKNYGAGTNTQSGVYLIKFHYDGNNTPSIQLIAGSNLATFGQSGSNTLTVAMGASNNMFTAIESSVVPTT